MTDKEKNDVVTRYVSLVGEQVLKDNEIARIQKELGLSHEEILELGKKIVLASLGDKATH